MGSPSPMAARAPLDRKLVARVRRLLDEREAATANLRQAALAVPKPTVASSLSQVAERLPSAISVDLATIRLADDDGHLHLVAAIGCTARDVRRWALTPLNLQLVRKAATNEEAPPQTLTDGVRWADFRWIGPVRKPIGLVAVASRTDRRPTNDEHLLLKETVGILRRQLDGMARRHADIRKWSLKLARASEADEFLRLDTAVGHLRPQERVVIGLYADGLSTADVADVLVISRHTVRTHVKHAMRTLGVNRREDAAEIVRATQLLQLV